MSGFFKTSLGKRQVPPRPGVLRVYLLRIEIVCQSLKTFNIFGENFV